MHRKSIVVLIHTFFAFIIVHSLVLNSPNFCYSFLSCLDDVVWYIYMMLITDASLCLGSVSISPASMITPSLRPSVRWSKNSFLSCPHWKTSSTYLFLCVYSCFPHTHLPNLFKLDSSLLQDWSLNEIPDVVLLTLDSLIGVICRQSFICSSLVCCLRYIPSEFWDRESISFWRGQ